MSQAVSEPSEAFLEAYYKGYSYMIELQEGQPENITADDLMIAGEHLMAALAIEAQHVQPYVLLASLFLVAGNRQMADKYVALAEGIDPEFPKLLELKEHMLIPESILRRQMGKSQDKSPLPVAQIPRLRPLKEPAKDESELFKFPDR